MSDLKTKRSTENALKAFATRKLEAHLWDELLKDDKHWQYGVPPHCQFQGVH